MHLTEKSMPIVSYWRWILSARSSKSRTMEGFSRDMAELRPDRTMAGHVRAMHSQSCKLARHTPLWFPKRQYKAPCRNTENGHHWLAPLSFQALEQSQKEPEKTVLLWIAAVWHCCCLGSRTQGRGGSDLGSRNCRSPVQWTTHFELCCVPGNIKLSVMVLFALCSAGFQQWFWAFMHHTS